MRRHTKNIAIIIILLLGPVTSYSKAEKLAFLYDKGIAVFYPEDFDSTRMLPSLAIMKDLLPAEALPREWDIRPVYSKNQTGKTIITISIGDKADLYGNGEVFGNLRRNGTSFTTWNTDNYMYQDDNGKRLYQSHPWILGVFQDGSAFGIISDNTWEQTFEISDPITIKCEGPSPRIIVIERESPQEVIKALASLIGTIEMPPLWALGFHQCRFTYTPDSRVKEVIDEFRARRIPCDVIWMDIDYMNGFRIFTFDKKNFPDPTGLNDYIHSKDFKAVYMIDPGVKIDKKYFVYRQGTKGDYWVKKSDGKTFTGKVWPGNCVFPDFTNPATREWWGSLYKDFIATGIDGVWNDMNEPSVFDSPNKTMPIDNIHMGGGALPRDIHLRYHNVYGMLMVESSRQGILNANPDKRPFVLSRANFLGGQRYGATWTGDNASTWQYLRMSIPMSLNLSMSGQPFSGPDIGGYALNASPELLAHWMALGAYYPFSRNHSSSGTSDQEPWAMGKKTEDVSRTALNRRYRLMPYLYTLFHDASVTGMPVMQPVYWSDIKDLSLREEQEAFILGENLLIIPRWANNPSLPKGNWNILKLEDDDDGYQPYVALRPGAIVPMTEIIQSTTEYTTDSVTLLVNPASDGFASGKLYDDAGDGFGYLNGDYSVTEFTTGLDNSGKLKVQILKTAGKRDAKRCYRIGYVTDGQIEYSAWTSDTTIYIDMIPDTQNGIDLRQLQMSEIRFKEKDLTLSPQQN
jgi:alpha-glucosidase